MIICESDGDLVLELFYNLLRYTMDKFFELVTSDFTSSPQLRNRTPNTDEIRSPIWYLNRSNSRRFYQRKILKFNPIIDVSKKLIDCYSDEREETFTSMYEKTGENYEEEKKLEANFSPGLKRRLFAEEIEASVSNSVREETQSNCSFNKSLEDFKISMMYEKTFHSSPKLLTSHFEDSGFLNYSMEMNSRMETISETEIPCEKKVGKSPIPFDSYYQEEKSQSKGDENSASNCQCITNSSSDQNLGGYSPKHSAHEWSNNA